MPDDVATTSTLGAHLVFAGCSESGHNFESAVFGCLESDIRETVACGSEFHKRPAPVVHMVHG